VPELPEVESIRRSLEPGLVGRRLERAEVRRRDVVVAPGDPAGGFSRQRAGAPRRPVPIPDELLLIGDTVEALDRRGKQLAVLGRRGGAIIVQLGMTGWVHLAEPGTDAAPHTHVEWAFDDGRVLRFVDPRRFGLVRLCPRGPAEAWAGLGPDALTVRARALADRLARTDRPIKAALLDQGVLAGVGNIYADEALHAARVHPCARTGLLDRETVTRLAACLRRTLRAAIEGGGSSIRDYRDSQGRPGSYQTRHNVYGRAGEPCRRCGSPLERALVAQRTTVFCPVCQPEDRSG